MQSTEQLIRDGYATDGHPSGPEPPAGWPRRWLRFGGRYLALVVAGFVGLFVIGGVLRVLLAAAGVAYTMGRHPELVIAEMGLTMGAGMVAWMRFRSHSRASILEVGAAMQVPAVVVIPLMWWGVLNSATGMLVEHVAMFPLLLAAMLHRRDEYTVPVHGRRAVRSLLRVARVVGRGLVVMLAFAVVPATVFVVDANAYEASRYAQPAATPTSAAALAAATPPVHDPAKPTAVVVVGNHGANVADTLVPYDVLTTTGAFNVYIVAPDRRPLPLLGGLDLVPDLSFAQLDERLGGAAPDVTIVPELPADEASDLAVTTWLRDTASDGLVVSVCAGARLVAGAGLLDGRDATTHWYRLAGLEKDFPAVRWQRGIRYVDNGDVITTGGLLSSVDGALRVVERFVDTDAATAAANAVGWRYYSPGTAAALPRSSLTVDNAVLHLLNVGFRANATTVGVMLTDGVGELELASAFAPYAEGRVARTLAVAAGDTIRSRHGLTFIARAGLDAAAGVDRLLVPGAAVAADPVVAAAVRDAGVPAGYLHQQPGFAFDGALREMASNTDVPTAGWAAKILEYSTAELGLTGPSWPWQPTLLPLLLGLVGVGGLVAAVGSVRLVRRARTRRG